MYTPQRILRASIGNMAFAMRTAVTTKMKEEETKRSGTAATYHDTMHAQKWFIGAPHLRFQPGLLPCGVWHPMTDTFAAEYFLVEESESVLVN